MYTDKYGGEIVEEQNIVSKTVNYIEQNLEKNLSLDKISEEMNYSKFHLNRLFSEKVGCTIYKYIQMRRITEAARKLVYTDAPVIDIALEANYNSQQAFTLAFRQIYLCTPQAYRGIGVFTPRQDKFSMYCKYNFYDIANIRFEGAAA